MSEWAQAHPMLTFLGWCWAWACIAAAGYGLGGAGAEKGAR
jgi:hypothetical protein